MVHEKNSLQPKCQKPKQRTQKRYSRHLKGWQQNSLPAIRVVVSTWNQRDIPLSFSTRRCFYYYLFKKGCNHAIPKLSLTSYFKKFLTPYSVAAKPKFSQPSKMRKKNLVRPLNSSVRLKCAATGYPKPQILWMKNSVTLTEAELGEEGASWTLKLINLHPSDTGEYTCVVHNRNGRINATYTVEVVGKIIVCF